MKTKEELEKEFTALTYQLKQMSGNEPDYQEIWDRRVEVRLQLMKLEK